ncbi:long-chain-acyl-CoA synthetase [Luteipulveratus sp. YIM 133132]|uniref:long-chain-acyl-CoA synthetase n=1 Tax=Luteipulveratus flavus TaxID=3031728 RepID=UPI0023AEDE66|nr:long-chain-acyl-CoA synthetase [Luteipulveratus sp. YIM 133132]MDE9364819.1 long-chain-acyl-CoA synthetase [Luteipulveratus sp. YIM 133132]
MSVQTRQRVGLLDVGKGLMRLTPDLGIVLKEGRGLITRKPTAKESIGHLFQRIAAKQPDRPFLKFENRVVSYGSANATVNRYATVLQEQGVRRGDVVGILAHNELETVLAMLATVKLGAVAGLLNYNQRGDTLAHSLGILDARVVLVSGDCLEVLSSAGDAGTTQNVLTFADLRTKSEGASEENPRITKQIQASEKAYYIFTSGTTGLPKASVMSHFRWLKSYSGLGGLGVRLRPDDTLYCCLPLYHNNSVTVALSSVLAGRASMAIGRKFSASRFWDDIVAYEATAFVYIGEVCRYLLSQPERPIDREHQVRVVVGNGLRQDIWHDFQQRFGIERIAEFYGASECNIAFINAYGLDETAGTCPLPYKVVEYDLETGEAVRDQKGRLRAVKTGEIGLLLAKVTDQQPFDGYTDDGATEKKLLRDGFKKGDCWFDTGDLVRHQGHQHIAFVDRLGDTFRWKGENVATTEVEAALGRMPGVSDCAVYGVEIPGTDGRAGMAAVVLQHGVDLRGQEFAEKLYGALPSYAVPLFIRVVRSLEQTSTFKSLKVELRNEGYTHGSDPVLVLKSSTDGYVEYYEEYPDEVARTGTAPR